MSTPFRLPPLCLLPAVLGLALVGPTLSAQHYDVLIRGGRVFDGTGTPWRYADVALKGDRIAVVGPIPATATAGTTIDARNKWVTPGFIDPHSHAAPGLMETGTAAAGALLFQGITSALINADGGGPADLAPQLARIQQQVPGVNVVPTIGNNGVRIAVMGHEGRPPTDAELAEMKRLVHQAMELGAFGLNTGLWAAPGPFTTTHELTELARVAAAFPGAFYISHIRDEGDYNVGLHAAVAEVIEIARTAKLPGIVTHIKAYGPSVHGRAGEIVQLINEARAQGVEVWADQYPYNFAGGGLANDLLPQWVVAGGFGPRVARLSDPEQLPGIRREMLVNLRRAGGAENIVIREYRPDESLIGKRLSEIASERSQEPIDLIVDLLKKGDAGMMQFNMMEPDVELFMQQPWTMTSTDGTLPEFGRGGAHPRSYGSFVRKLRKYALDKPVITPEQAIHRSSGLTATVLGVQERGFLRPGSYADVLVLDPATLRERSTYQQPHAYCEGLDWVFVNGRAAIAEGKLTELRHGRVLLRHQQ